MNGAAKSRDIATNAEEGPSVTDARRDAPVAISQRARSLLTVPRALAGLPILRDLSWFWPIYLHHHRRPTTRRFHQVGSVACIVGGVMSLVLGMVGPLLAGLAIGYLCAFSGHWIVEKNRPLTFGYPILAGLCNWIMFFLELTHRLERHLQVVEDEADSTWNDVEMND